MLLCVVYCTWEIRQFCQVLIPKICDPYTRERHKNYQQNKEKKKANSSKAVWAEKINSIF